MIPFSTQQKTTTNMLRADRDAGALTGFTLRRFGSWIALAGGRCGRACELFASLSVANRRCRGLIAGVFLLAASSLFAAEFAADKLTVAGIAEFTAAYQAWDGARFATAAELFHQATTNATATVTNFYWLGAGHFHRMLQLQNGPESSTNQAGAESALNAAVDALTTAVELDEHHAESHALLGTLYGMKIKGSLLRALRFGPRVQKHRVGALATGAQNPRVHYLLGMCEFHTASKPKDWRATLATLLAAEKLFEAEAKRANSCLEPRWGRSSCCTFIGRTYEQLGETAKAAAYFRKALAEHPADHLAQAGLARTTKK